jgi:hypothetical protein
LSIATLTASLFVAVASVRAQVGYPPARSPYLDLLYTQEITAIVGYYVGREDPAGVAPGNGPVIGAHYEWRAGGPAHLTSEIVRIGSKRTVLDPNKPAATRNLGERSWPLYAADFGLGLSLTGAKSWHQIVPEVRAALGFVSDFRRPDVGGFRYGTRFALTWGAGLRYVPGGNFQLRADFTNRLVSISYPDAYFRAPSGGGPAILTGKDNSVWRNNPSFTLGFSYLFSR